MVEPNETTPQTVEGTPQEPERFAIEFPPDLEGSGAGPEAAPAAGEVTKEEVTPTGEVPKKMVPKAALDAERTKRKAARELYEATERERQRVTGQLEENRRRQADAVRQAVPPKKYGEIPDMNQAFDEFGNDMRREFHAHKEELRQQNVATRVLLSEKYFRKDHPDYDDLMVKSGLDDLLRPDPTTGRVKDPVLLQMFWAAPDPAEFAYHYARGKLGEEIEETAEERGVQKGRQEVVQQVVRNAERPRGIHALPASSGAKIGGLSFGDIDALPDEKKMFIKTKHPDLWRRYMEAVPPPPRR